MAEKRAEFVRSLGLFVAANRHDKINKLPVLRRQLPLYKSLQILRRRTDRSIRPLEEQATRKAAPLREHYSLESKAAANPVNPTQAQLNPS